MLNIELWVREIEDTDNPRVLFYKTQGNSCADHPYLKNDDFILIIMTEAQDEFLKKIWF